MPPITWRNVDAPDFSAASRMLSQAQTAMNGALSAFAAPIQQAEATATQNWNTQANVNTDAFMRRLQAIKSPEELAAAQPELDAMRAGFGAQVDMKGTRDAMTALPGRLQAEWTAAQAYKDNKATVDARPITDALTGLVLQGRVKEAQAATDAYQAANMLPPGAAERIFGAAYARSRQDTQDSQAAEKLVLEKRSANRQDMLAKSTVDYQTAQAGRWKAEDTLRQTLAEAQANQAGVAQLQAANAQLLKQSILGEGSLDTKEGRATFAKQMKDVYQLSDNAINDVMENVFNKYPKGTFSVNRIAVDDKGKVVEVKDKNGNPIVDEFPIPLSMATNAVAGTSEFFSGNWWSRRGDRALGKLIMDLKNPDNMEDIKAALKMRDGGSLQVMDAAQARADAAGVPLYVPPAPVAAAKGGARSSISLTTKRDMPPR